MEVVDCMVWCIYSYIQFEKSQHTFIIMEIGIEGCPEGTGIAVYGRININTENGRTVFSRTGG